MRTLTPVTRRLGLALLGSPLVALPFALHAGLLALSPVPAGRFLQIENQIGIFIDLTIAAEMPLVGSGI